MTMILHKLGFHQWQRQADVWGQFSMGIELVAVETCRCGLMRHRLAPEKNRYCGSSWLIEKPRFGMREGLASATHAPQGDGK